jgi:hypothetical protein
MTKAQSLTAAAAYKIFHARELIESIRSRLSPLPGFLYTLTFDPVRSIAVLAEPNAVDVRYKPDPTIAFAFQAIIGNVVNNLREGLDYWIKDIEEQRYRSRKWSFPFGKRKGDLARDERLKKIRDTWPGLADFIEQVLEPTADGKTLLYAATALSNTNKHDSFIATLTATSIEGLDAVTKTNRMTNFSIAFDATQELVPLRLIEPLSYSTTPKISATLHFAPGTLFPGKDVVTTLGMMADEVESAMARLNAFVEPHL